MNLQEELIVHPDRKSIIIGLTFLFFLVMAGLILLILINSLKKSISSFYFSYVLTFIQIIYGFFIAIFIYGWILLFMQVVDKRPIAILNRKGIWTKNNGLILWRHIEAVCPYAIHFDTPEHFPIQIQIGRITVGIRIKKDSLPLVEKQSSFLGKLAISWMKFFGPYYAKSFNLHHIYLGGTATSEKELMSFTHRYIKKNLDKCVLSDNRNR